MIRFWRGPRLPPSNGKVKFIRGCLIIEPTVRAKAKGGIANSARYRRLPMRLSAPIYHLKRRAKLLAPAAGLPLHEALDRIAIQEGYSGWSLLAARHAALTPAAELFGRLAQGDLVLVGARLSQGKTLMALRLTVEAMKSGSRGVFFTLEYTEKDILERFRAIGAEPAQ